MIKVFGLEERATIVLTESKNALAIRLKFFKYTPKSSKTVSVRSWHTDTHTMIPARIRIIQVDMSRSQWLQHPARFTPGEHRAPTTPGVGLITETDTSTRKRHCPENCRWFITHIDQTWIFPRYTFVPWLINDSFITRLRVCLPIDSLSLFHRILLAVWQNPVGRGAAW